MLLIVNILVRHIVYWLNIGQCTNIGKTINRQFVAPGTLQPRDQYTRRPGYQCHRHLVERCQRETGDPNRGSGVS